MSDKQRQQRQAAKKQRHEKQRREKRKQLKAAPGGGGGQGGSLLAPLAELDLPGVEAGLVEAMARRMQANLRRATTPPRRAPRRSDVVYRLRVTLDGTEPPIWRLLEVAGDITLGGLSGAIMKAMPWGDDHLYGLTIDGREYGPKMAGAFGPTSLDEEDYRLSEVVTQIGEAFTFTYDYGDNWSHTCVVEAIAPLEPGAGYPREVGRERAAPPEDIGGVGGFYDWIVACLDPADSEHEWMLERAEAEGWTPARMAQEWLTPAQHEAWKAGRKDWTEA